MVQEAYNIVAGMIFGAALTLSGVASPRVIQDQFKLIDFHMLVTFLSASASNAVIIAAYNFRRPNQALPVKPRSTLGLWAYDANVVGGAMIGAGMAMTGACPGTVIVQAAGGIGRSRVLLVSTMLAGIVFVKWKRSSETAPKAVSQVDTVMTASGWTPAYALTMYEIAMLAAVAVSLGLAPRSQTTLHPVIGGLLIAVGQLSSILLVNRPVGVSSAYEDIGKAFWDTVDATKPDLLSTNVLFLLSLAAGARATMIESPSTRSAMAQSSELSLSATVIGGFLLTFGARTAGGCTSGHGISGMAAMGLSSFVTVASMFASGILCAQLLT